jgi:hypothetical protein
MPLSADKQKTLDEYLKSLEGSMSAEDLNILRETFSRNEGAADRTAQQVMTFADFSRRGLQLNQELDVVNRQRQEVAAKMKEIAEYERKALEWENYLKDNSVPRAEYEAAQNTIKQLRSYKDEVKTSLKELELSDLVDDPEEGTMPQDNNRAARNGSPSQPQQGQQGQNPERPIHDSFTTNAQVQKLMVETVLGSALGTAQLFQLNNEFRQLTGRDIGSNPGEKTMDELVLEAVKAGKPQMEYIREVLQFGKLKEEKQAASMEAEIDRRATEKFAKMASEAKLPFGTGDRAPTTTLSEVLFKEDQTHKGKPVQPGRFGEGSRRATEAYLTGRYRGENTGSSII